MKTSRSTGRNKVLDGLPFLLDALPLDALHLVLDALHFGLDAPSFVLDALGLALDAHVLALVFLYEVVLGPLPSLLIFKSPPYQRELASPLSIPTFHAPSRSP